MTTNGKPKVQQEPGSFIERARKERERLSKPRVKVFELPGYSNIAVRYGVLSYAMSRELVEKSVAQGNDADADLYVAAESLLEMCQTFVYREDEKDQWREWSHNGQPVRYDANLIELLGIEMTAVDTSPRDFVYELFGGLPHADRPLMTHYFEIVNWMDNLEVEVSEESVGKSSKAASSTSSQPVLN